MSIIIGDDQLHHDLLFCRLMACTYRGRLYAGLP